MLTSRDALVLVDVQNDFCPGGALPVKGGDKIVPVLNDWIERARQGGATILASRDWHPRNHVSFTERGGPWPRHCIHGTAGAKFHSQLQLPKSARIISKGTARDRDQYSALADTRLVRQLKRSGVERIWVGGLALDVCVRKTVLDALQAGFEVHLLRAATRAVNVRKGDDRRTLAELQKAGCILEEEPTNVVRRGKKARAGTVRGPVRADDGPGVRRRVARSTGRVRTGISHAAKKPKLRHRRRAGKRADGA